MILITEEKQNEIMAALLALQSANPKVDDFPWPPPSYLTETAAGISHLTRRAVSVFEFEHNKRRFNWLHSQHVYFYFYYFYDVH